MSNLPVRSLYRPIVLVVVIIFILTSWNRNGAYRDTMAQQQDHPAGAVLSNLAVRIRQASTSPPTLALSVTNNHDAPLTILRWKTPLDPLAIQLGVLSITPEGKSEALELPTIELRRIMPPPPQDLITLQPGERREQEVVLKEPIVPLDQLGKTVRVAVKGKWQTVWPTTADKLSQETIEKLQFGDGVLTGEFESEMVDVTIS
ncbi:putative secreted protein [Colletotrichum tanaceti]|uniref:Putative secreted protein n=1 Tax=Colletotrichum tanaceti TaxID=1306861 RepID=A0A4U6X584_9PEZI|nr:putative secreted protein [Colletotrichum tanaceti]TKW50592.1 putative secreted protein [Colletotrichum tanaceti]